MSEMFEEAKKFAESHPQQVDEGIEEAGRQAEKHTDDRYDKEIDKAVSEAERYVDGDRSKTPDR